MFVIEISDRQHALELDVPRIKQAVAAILSKAGFNAAELSIAVVDDATIHELNRQFLEHDYPTDVLSFVLESDRDRIEGEVIVSSETSIRSAAQVGWSPENELLLYIIHGTLHVVGYDDTTAETREVMRQQERLQLANLGLEVPLAGRAESAPLADH